MAVSVTTDTPSEIIAGIKQQIKDNEIRTWLIVTIEKTDYYTHTAEQYDGLAFFFTSIKEKELVFNLTWYKNEEPNLATKGIYHGRFIQMLCNHFSDYFSSIQASFPD